MAHSPLSAFTSHHTATAAVVDNHHHGYATIQPNVQAHSHMSSKQRYAELMREAAQINDPPINIHKHRDQGINSLIYLLDMLYCKTIKNLLNFKLSLIYLCYTCLGHYHSNLATQNPAIQPAGQNNQSTAPGQSSPSQMRLSDVLKRKRPPKRPTLSSR